jgi:hypothetical protein
MRKLNHPIAVFVVAVLVVIGIGVGVVAAVQTSKIYGPSWGRFTAAFPGRVYGGEGLSTGQLAGNVYFHSSESYAGRAGRPGVLITDGVSAHQILEPQQVSELVLEVKRTFPVRLTESTEHINGFLTTRLGPIWVQRSCDEVLIVVHNRTCWFLSATSSVGCGSVVAFMDSFEPIG